MQTARDQVRREGEDFAMSSHKMRETKPHVCCWERQYERHRCILCCQCGKRIDIAQPVEEAGAQDEFNFMSAKVMNHLVDVCIAAEDFAEPVRSGMISAMEEFYFRMSNGHHFDWHETKQNSAKVKAKMLSALLSAAGQGPPAQSSGPMGNSKELVTPQSPVHAMGSPQGDLQDATHSAPPVQGEAGAYGKKDETAQAEAWAKLQESREVQDCIDAMCGACTPDSGLDLIPMTMDEFEDRVRPIVAHCFGELLAAQRPLPDELRALSEKATPGLWQVFSVYGVGQVDDQNMLIQSVICHTANNKRTRTPENAANAALIVRAVNYVRQLLAAEREQEGEQ
jgi:hypothetical protein